MHDKDPLILYGDRLTLQEVEQVAREGRKVVIAPEAEERVIRAFNTVTEAIRTGRPDVYGLNGRLGPFQGGQASYEAGDQPSSRLSVLSAHAMGAGEEIEAQTVLASMVVRLNMALRGRTGLSPDVVRCYEKFINHRIAPIVLEDGTVGQGDLVQTAHIGLAMAGEWKVYFRGWRMQTWFALKLAGVSQVQLDGKDHLSVMSTNAVTVANAVLGIQDASRLLKRLPVVFGLALEALNGNVAPRLESVTQARPYPKVTEAATLIQEALEGSSLWNRDKDRDRQDPLSFRDIHFPLGVALLAVERADEALSIHINHSDDNPLISTREDDSEPRGVSEQVDSYRIPGQESAAVYPTGNHDIYPVLNEIENLSKNLAALAHFIGHCINTFGKPELTNLSRWLAAPGNHGHAFGVAAKPINTILEEIATLAQPVSLRPLPLPEERENVGYNSWRATANLRRIVDKFYELASILLLVAAQGVDLRKGFILGKETGLLHAAYRKEVPFADVDRAFTQDITKGEALLRNWTGGVAGLEQELSVQTGRGLFSPLSRVRRRQKR